MNNHTEIQYINKFRNVLRKFERGLFFQNNESCCKGVTLAQCHALLEIEQKQDISITELSAFLGLDKSTISRTVDSLVNIGLVNRITDPENRRTAVLNLTETGKKTCEIINQNNDLYFENILNELNDNEKHEFVRSMEKIAEKMQSSKRKTDQKT